MLEIDKDPQLRLNCTIFSLNLTVGLGIKCGKKPQFDATEVEKE